MQNLFTTLNNNRHCVLILIGYFFTFPAMAIEDSGCAFWINKLVYVPSDSRFDAKFLAEDFNYELKAHDPWSVSQMSDEKKIETIRCFLSAENDRREAVLTGSQRFNTSQIFAPAHVDLAALYAISYIYSERIDHSSAVALRGENSSYTNSNGAYVTKRSSIRKAYKAYRAWFSKIREIGLANVKKVNLQPLDDSSLAWY